MWVFDFHEDELPVSTVQVSDDVVEHVLFLGEIIAIGEPLKAPLFGTAERDDLAMLP